MMRMIFWIALLGMAFATTACRPGDLYMVNPQGPPEYRLGWEDGCDSGVSAQGSPLFKAIFGFKKRPEMGNNELYKQAWNEGFTYCRFTTGNNNQSFDNLGF